MTKEEILDKYAVGVMAGQYTIDCEKAELAMDDYAKQMSIGFRNWEPPIGSYTDEELYKLYIQQLK